MDGPPDIRMMGIVHDALRRDLVRTRAALADAVPEARRRALAARVAWMMHFLHAHHEGEDAGGYPVVRAANPAAGALLDAMAVDHAAVDPAVESLRTAAARWGASGADADRTAVLDALTALEAVLLPHLDREETEAMAVVSARLRRSCAEIVVRTVLSAHGRVSADGRRTS